MYIFIYLKASIIYTNRLTYVQIITDKHEHKKISCKNKFLYTFLYVYIIYIDFYMQCSND